MRFLPKSLDTNKFLSKELKYRLNHDTKPQIEWIYLFLLLSALSLEAGFVLLTL